VPLVCSLSSPLPPPPPGLYYLYVAFEDREVYAFAVIWLIFVIAMTIGLVRKNTLTNNDKASETRRDKPRPDSGAR